MRKSVLMVLLVSVVAAIMVLAGCGGGSGGQSAEEAAKSFFSAYQNRDADTTWNLLSSDSTKSVEKSEWAEYLKDSDTITFKVGKVTVDGDEATAAVTASLGGEESTEDVPLVKEKGVWKVDMAGMKTE